MVAARVRRRSRAELEEIRLFAEHHIVDVRRSRKGRTIVAVKHVAFGWISPRAYYALQEIHANLPKIVEGGYRFKQAIATVRLDVLGVGVPFGGVLFAYEIAHLAAATGGFDVRTMGIWDRAEVLFWVAALVAPFGEILAMVRLMQDLGLAAKAEAATPEERGGAGGETTP